MFIGSHDSHGRLLVLGGHSSDLWRLPDGKYQLDNIIVDTSSEAMQCYNQFNNAGMQLDYIEVWFNSWYNKNKGGNNQSIKLNDGKTAKLIDGKLVFE